MGTGGCFSGVAGVLKAPIRALRRDRACDVGQPVGPARRRAPAGGIGVGFLPPGARRLAAGLGPGRRVVTILIDSGLKYLAGDLFAA
jgi:cysteine synthase